MSSIKGKSVCTSLQPKTQLIYPMNWFGKWIVHTTDDLLASRMFIHRWWHKNEKNIFNTFAVIALMIRIINENLIYHIPHSYAMAFRVCSSAIYFGRCELYPTANLCWLVSRINLNVRSIIELKPTLWIGQQVVTVFPHVQRAHPFSLSIYLSFSHLWNCLIRKNVYFFLSIVIKLQIGCNSGKKNHAIWSCFSWQCRTKKNVHWI